MNNEDYTTLSHFARHVLAEPTSVDSFADALSSDLGEQPTLSDRRDLADAIEAIRSAWHRAEEERRQSGQPRSGEDEHGRDPQAVPDIAVDVIKRLKEVDAPAAELAATALITAAQDLLVIRRRKRGLSRAERQIAGTLPDLAGVS